jgi:hypothetical protein
LANSSKCEFNLKKATAATVAVAQNGVRGDMQKSEDARPEIPREFPLSTQLSRSRPVWQTAGMGA